jgi:hypothetical protein
MVLGGHSARKGNSAHIAFEGGQMAKLVHLSRFIVREGSKGWFVYDRERKGPANLRTHLAERLTKEQAEEIQRRLTVEFDEVSNSVTDAGSAPAGRQSI